MKGLDGLGVDAGGCKRLRVKCFSHAAYVSGSKVYSLQIIKKRVCRALLSGAEGNRDLCPGPRSVPVRKWRLAGADFDLNDNRLYKTILETSTVLIYVGMV